MGSDYVASLSRDDKGEGSFSNESSKTFLRPVGSKRQADYLDEPSSKADYRTSYSMFLRMNSQKQSARGGL